MLPHFSYVTSYQTSSCRPVYPAHTITPPNKRRALLPSTGLHKT
jgi:hypothetical protein